MEIEEIQVTNTFTQTSTVSVPFNDFQRVVVNKPIHVVVDGLNLIAATTREIFGSNPEKFGIMDVERAVEIHHLDDKEDMLLVFRTIKAFIEVAVPVGSIVHFVMKQSGSRVIWDKLKESFCSVFWDGSLASCSYVFYTALSGWRNPLKDKERDDRLSVRLTLELLSLGERAYLITNDNCKSLSNHWNFDCVFDVSSDRNTMAQPVRDSLECPMSLIDYVRNIDRIKFSPCSQVRNDGNYEVVVVPVGLCVF